MNRASKIALLLALVTGLAMHPATAQIDCAQLISGANDRIVKAVRDRYSLLEADMSERYRLIDELVKPYFDFEFGSRQLLDDYWQDATPELRSRFQIAFYDYLVASYGNLLTDYGANTLRVNGDCSPWALDDIDVTFLKATLTLNDKSEVELYFFMREVDQNLKIFDIQANGTSQVAHFRSQFSEQLEDEGLEPLIAWLEEEAAEQRRLALLPRGQPASGSGGDLPDD